jgi:hypothetical protein
MSFTKGDCIYYKIADGSIVYGTYEKKSNGRCHVKKEDGKIAYPPLNGVFHNTKKKCQCDREELCEWTGWYDNEDMHEGLCSKGTLWFHSECIKEDHPDSFNFCQDCSILVYCDLSETLVFDTTGIMDFCPECWEGVSEEDRKEGRQDEDES